MSNANFLVAKLVESRLNEILQEDIAVRRFVNEKDITIDDILQFSGHKTKQNSTKDITHDDLNAMLSASYETGWRNTSKYCAVYHGNVGWKTHPHSYCGNECTNWICSDCAAKPANAKLLEEIKSGNFDPLIHVDSNAKKRIISAKLLLRKQGYESIKITKTLSTIVYKHNRKQLYEPSRGLVLDVVQINGETSYVTVGIDEKCIGKTRKLTPKEVKMLSENNVVIGKNSMSTNALKVLD